MDFRELNVNNSFSVDTHSRKDYLCIYNYGVLQQDYQQDLTKSLTLKLPINFILYAIVLFSSSSLIEELYIFLYFLPNIQTDLEILLLAL